jgi:WD40 repeat protein
VHKGTRVLHSWASPMAAPVAISRDGTRAAVLNADAGLSVSRLDGTAEVQLVAATGRPYGSVTPLDWSPDGSRIVYAERFPGGALELRIIGADGSGDRLVAAGGPTGSASWSPDGTRILAGALLPPGSRPTPPFAPTRLELLAVDGSSRSPIPNTDGAGGGVWSPDGSQIAFGRGGRYGDGMTWIIAPDGSGLRPLGLRGLVGIDGWSAGPRLTRPVRTLPPPPPTVHLATVGGQVKVKRPGAAGFDNLQAGTYLARTRIDALGGTLRLSPSRDYGLVADTTVRGGIFELSRISRRRVDLRLTTTQRCGGSLRADAGFALRVRGRRSTTTGRNAAWSVVDRCDGATVTTVHRGRVSVRDLKRKRTRTLRAGARYAAR